MDVQLDGFASAEKLRSLELLLAGQTEECMQHQAVGRTAIHGHSESRIALVRLCGSRQAPSNDVEHSVRFARAAVRHRCHVDTVGMLQCVSPCQDTEETEMGLLCLGELVSLLERNPVIGGTVVAPNDGPRRILQQPPDGLVGRLVVGLVNGKKEVSGAAAAKQINTVGTVFLKLGLVQEGQVELWLLPFSILLGFLSTFWLAFSSL